MNLQPKVTEVKDGENKIRVYMTVGVSELYIDIEKRTGFSPDASVNPNVAVWGKMYRAAANAINKSFPGKYPSIKA